MYLDVTLVAGSERTASSLTRGATELGLNLDLQPNGGRLGRRLRFHGEVEDRTIFDGLVRGYDDISDVTENLVIE